MSYAALKGRSSTAMRVFVIFSEVSKPVGSRSCRKLPAFDVLTVTRPAQAIMKGDIMLILVPTVMVGRKVGDVLPLAHIEV